MIFSDMAIERIIGIKTVKNSMEGALAFVNIIVAAFITWIVFRHKKRIKPNEKHTPGFLFRRELVADIFLICSISIFSFIFWEKSIMALLTNRARRHHERYYFPVYHAGNMFRFILSSPALFISCRRPYQPADMETAAAYFRIDTDTVSLCVAGIVIFLLF